MTLPLLNILNAARDAQGPDLVCIGNLLVDDIVFSNGTTLMGEPGGAALYVSLGAWLWGAKVAVVSLRGDDYPESMLATLAGRGIDVTAVRDLTGPGVRTWLLYEPHGRRVIHQLGGVTHLAVSPAPDDVPERLRRARAFHLAPMPLPRQRELVRSLGAQRDAAITLDPYETVREDNLAEWRDVLAQVDAFFPSEDELLLDGVADDPQAAVRRLAGGRLRFVVFKRGVQGGMLYDARADGFIEWPPVPRLTGDPTGAGDSFAGGFLAGLLAGGGLEQSLDQGIIATSFTLEALGARGLLAATREDAERRRREWFDGARA